MNEILSDQILRTVQDIVIEQYDLSREQLADEARLEDLGDSLTAIQTSMAIEEELEIIIPDEAFGPNSTLGDLYKIVAEALNQSRAKEVS